MGAITLDGIYKTYPGKPPVEVLRDIHLAIASGEFLVLVGPSGCGKSTLLRILAGLEAQTQGRVTIGERCVDAVLPKDRDVAMVFQNYALYPHMSVYDNMAFGLKMRKVARADIETRVQQAAQTLGLEAYLKRKPAQLSGGQRQRVALGRAMVRQPQVFLMDEPLSNLDAKMRIDMRAELMRLHQQLGVTTVYVTHDQTEAMTMGHRMVVLHEGRLAQCDTPMTVYQRPATVFVANFIGQMNFLPPGLVPEQGSAAETLGFRPEQFVVLPEGGAEGGGAAVQQADLGPVLTGTLAWQELLGAEWQLSVALPDVAAPLLVRVPVSQLSVPLVLGQAITVLPQWSHVHRFSAETGVRV